MARHFLKNPGFELGDRDWIKGAGWTIVNDVAAARSGSWVAKSNGASAIDIIANNSFVVHPGSKISVSAWIETLGLTAGGGRLFLRWRDLNDVNISTLVATDVGIGQAYTKATIVDVVAPDRAKNVTVNLRNIETIVGGSMLVDDFELSGDIIESIPASAGLSNYRIVSANTIGVFDPLIGDDKFTDFNAGMSDKWGGVYTFTKQALGANFNDLLAFLQRIGNTERFFAFDPDRKTPVGGIVNGLTVNGAVTQGTTRIPVKDGTADTTPLIAGDHVEVRAQYFQLQRNLDIGPEGTGDMIVWPAVRSDMIDDEDVITDNPKIVARITSDLEWARTAGDFSQITISWQEV